MASAIREAVESRLRWLALGLAATLAVGGGLHGQPTSRFVEALPESGKLVNEARSRLNAYRWRNGMDPRALARIYDARGSQLTALRTVLDDRRRPAYERWTALQRLTGALRAAGDVDAAAALWRSGTALFGDPDLAAAGGRLAAITLEKDGPIQILSGGDGLNSPDYEYLPIPELSGDRIYFTARNRADRRGGEDIWLAVRQPGNTENPSFRAAPVPGLNTKENEGPDAISPNGTTLYMFGNYPGSRGQGDIFSSTLSKDGWGPVRPLPAPINSPYFESDAFVTADGRALLFASDRPGGYYPYKAKNLFAGGDWWGNTDLYISFIQADGSFAKPRNLGSLVNTPGSERSPYLHPDGKTLYFASSGYAENSFGDMDVYKTVRLDDTWQNWSPPENVGTVVNGSGTDWGFRLTASALEGYFSGVQKDNQGGDDIYRITPLPKRAQPAEPVTAVRGQILDENGNPVQAEIEWQDRETGEKLGSIQSRPDNGEFFLTLPQGRSYAYFAKRPGYLSQTLNLDAPRSASYSESSTTVELITVDSAQKNGEELTLSNVNFATGSAELTKNSVGELERLLRFLRENPKLRVEVRGHTDNTGGRAQNVRLSEARAKSVLNHLISKGIAAERLRAKGFGPDRPVATNDTAAGRLKNRRVTFVVLGSGE